MTKRNFKINFTLKVTSVTSPPVIKLSLPVHLYNIKKNCNCVKSTLKIYFMHMKNIVYKRGNLANCFKIWAILLKYMTVDQSMLYNINFMLFSL